MLRMQAVQQFCIDKHALVAYWSRGCASDRSSLSVRYLLQDALRSLNSLRWRVDVMPLLAVAPFVLAVAAIRNLQSMCSLRSILAIWVPSMFRENMTALKHRGVRYQRSPLP